MAEQVEKLVKVYKNTKVDAQMLKDADVDQLFCGNRFFSDYD
ncbi:MAG: hypothetical protein ACLVAS_08705 [Mediterraneibacter gnavus]